LNTLTQRLNEFFGQFAVLGCTDGTVPVYSGRDLAQVHQPLGIPAPVFDRFNQILLKVTGDAGVSQADNNAILGVLETTRTAIVQQPKAPTTPTPGGPTGPRSYTVSCGGAGNCGSGGVYTLTQTLPTQGSPQADPDITCFAGETITFSFPTSLPSHPFLVIDGTGAAYPGAPAAFSSTGNIQFTCVQGMSTNPAYYTCTNHGGSPGAAMTGKFILGAAPNPGPGPGPGPNPPGPGPNPPGPGPNPGGNNGLTGGEVVGILIALFFVLIVVTVAVTCCCLKVVLKK